MKTPARTHTSTPELSKDPGYFHKGLLIEGKWEIRNDTLLIRETEDNVISKKLVMHNGVLHFIRMDGSADPASLMTKKDYKFYQRQCRQSGK